MKVKNDFIYAVVSTAILVVLLIVFDISSEYHFIISQLIILQVVFGVFFFRRLVVYSTTFILLFYVILDSIVLSALPTNELAGSVILIGILILLLQVSSRGIKINQRMKNILEATRVGTWEWNFETGEVIVNERWAEMLGYKLSDLGPSTIQTWERLTEKEDVTRAYQQLEKVMNGDFEYYDIEIRMHHRDGNIIWVHDRGKITLRSRQGKPLLMSGTHTDVTEKRKAEEKIRRLHELMSYVIDNMNSGVAIHDKDLNYIYVSKHYMDQYHITGNIIGRHHYDVFPDLPQKWRDVHQRVLKGEILSADRDEYPHEDGTVETTRWECRPWFDEFGEIGGIIVYTEVIDEFIAIEKELSRSKDMLQLVMDNLPIGISVNSVFPSVKFQYMNDEFPKSYNTTREELEKGDFWDVVYEDEAVREKIKKMVLEDISSGDPKRMRWEDVPLSEGGEIKKYVTASNTPIPGADMVISTVIDTTPRKQLELSLREKADEIFVEKEKIEATLLAIGDAVISTDESGRITAINDVASDLTGYSKKEALGLPFNRIFNIVHETTDEQLDDPVNRVLETGRTIHLENHTVLISKDGTRRIIEDSVSPIRNIDGTLIGVILVFRDVTDKRKKQDEIIYLSEHDYLTGLFNRRYFTKALEEVDRPGNYPVGVMMIDLNGLKIINDAYGHNVGDQALISCASVIAQVVSDRGIVSRIGGDEFTVLFTKTSHDELYEYKQRINESISSLAIRNVTLSMSIGFEVKTAESQPIFETVKQAEDFMYKYKLTDGASARNNAIQAILTTLTNKYELERIHSVRVGELSRRLGEALGLPTDDVKTLELSGLFHDIGKISLPDSILNKPDRLTPEEYEIVKEHPLNGYMILRAADKYSNLAENALLHHERYDGTGYPNGLAGDKIPLQARIIAIADAYEAMTSDRPYRKAMTNEEAIAELLRNRGTQFDPALTDLFVNKVLS